MKYLSLILSLTLLHALPSCQQTENTQLTDTIIIEEVENLTLSSQGIKTFVLPELVDFEGLYGIQINKFEDQEYFSFFDRQTNAFHIHNYASGQLIQSTELAKEGPNHIQVFLNPTYHLHSLDSIFINTRYYGYFLIDAKGQILSKVSDGSRLNTTSKMQVDFNESSYFDKGSLYGSIIGHHQKKAEHLPFIQGKINFENGKLTTDSTHAGSIYEDYDALHRFFTQAKKENKLYVNIHRHVIRHEQ